MAVDCHQPDQAGRAAVRAEAGSRPPTATAAACILNEAWVADPDWGTLVWLAMVTGIGRGELCALRWRHVDWEAGVLAVRQSIWQRGKQVGEKDAKDHQKRRVALDAETLEVLTEHRQRLGGAGSRARRRTERRRCPLLAGARRLDTSAARFGLAAVRDLARSGIR